MSKNRNRSQAARAVSALVAEELEQVERRRAEASARCPEAVAAVVAAGEVAERRAVEERAALSAAWLAVELGQLSDADRLAADAERVARESESESLAAWAAVAAALYGGGFCSSWPG